MCKSNQLLILFVCCSQLVHIGVSIPLGTLFDDDYADEVEDSDYDLHYDERQNGTENYRLNINGVVIAVPGASSSAVSNVGLLATNYLLELAEAAADGAGAHDEVVDDDDEGDDHPYDFVVPAGGVDDEDKNENIEPVLSISAASIIKPSTTTASSDSVVLDLKPENEADAVIEKQSSTNKKDLKVEVIRYEDSLKSTSAPPTIEEVKIVQPTVVTSGTRRASAKASMKRKNK